MAVRPFSVLLHKLSSKNNIRRIHSVGQTNEDAAATIITEKEANLPSQRLRKVVVVERKAN